MPRYIYPPHPKLLLHHSSLAQYEANGQWIWQRKFNGDRCVVAIEYGKCYLGNRHGSWHSPASMSVLRQELLALNLPEGTHYLDGELLPDQTIVLFDILQHKDYLYGASQMKRLGLLAEVCRHPTQLCDAKIALQVSPHVWLAEWGDKGFERHFREFLDHDLIEGLVLRRQASHLDGWGSRQYDVTWQLRVRKPSKKYAF